jgi:hypothetical protein
LNGREKCERLFAAERPRDFAEDPERKRRRLAGKILSSVIPASFASRLIFNFGEKNGIQALSHNA